MVTIIQDIPHPYIVLENWRKKEDDKESKEPDYDEDKDQLEEKQEEETGELKETTTTNQVF